MMTFRRLGHFGRLGNQLWEIASTIGIAHRGNETAGFPFWRYQPYFSVPSDLFPDLTAVDGEDLINHFVGVEGLDYLQDLRYLVGVEDLIRQYLAPRPELRERIRRRNASLLALPHKTAVHVRRGDYLSKSDTHPALPLDYYRDAMALLPPPYLVFSDDLAWCRANFPQDSCVFIAHNRDYEDLFLMAMCEAHITSNSTFSWWGAWLGEGPAVYPRNWYGPSLHHLDPSVFLPDGAILLEGVPNHG